MPTVGVEAPDPARREEGEYPVYLTDEQRRGAGCIGSQSWHLHSPTAPYFSRNVIPTAAWWVSAVVWPLPPPAIVILGFAYVTL